jgi:hypothetical protein
MPTTPPGGSPSPRATPPLRQRFRWELTAIPVALLVGPWFLGGFEGSVHCSEVMSNLGVHRPVDYAATVCLAATLAALLACLRIIRSR